MTGRAIGAAVTAGLLATATGTALMLLSQCRIPRLRLLRRRG